MTNDPPFVRTIEKVLSFVQAVCVFTAAAALVLLVASFGWLVFGRYVLNITPTWVEQLALLLICYIAFLGAAAGVRENTHIGVTLFRDLLPLPAQKLTMICIDLILAGFGAIMLSAGITLMKFGWSTMLPMLDIPESIRTAAITLLGGLTVLFAGSRAILRIIRFRDWSPDAPSGEA